LRKRIGGSASKRRAHGLATYRFSLDDKTRGTFDSCGGLHAHPRRREQPVAKKQTRRSISVSKATYERAKAFAEQKGVSLSQLTEVALAHCVEHFYRASNTEHAQ
jgi:hypothetical protein